jgi:hypothetical protein
MTPIAIVLQVPALQWQSLHGFYSKKQAHEIARDEKAVCEVFSADDEHCVMIDI